MSSPADEARLEAVIEAAQARATRLMDDGPGKVQIRPAHEIGQVRLLRACTALLSETERRRIRQARDHLTSLLYGVEIEPPPPPVTMADRMRRIFAPTQADRDGRRMNHVYREKRLKPPPALINAGEAWIIATYKADAVDDDVTPILEPWEQASVEPR